MKTCFLQKKFLLLDIFMGGFFLKLKLKKSLLGKHWKDLFSFGFKKKSPKIGFF